MSKASDGEEKEEKKEKTLKKTPHFCVFCVGVFTFDKRRRIFSFPFS